jgi:hypothetical protein
MREAIHLERETWEKAVAIADGFWVIATHHRPGFMKMSPDINNRCFVFKLREGEREVLVVANGVDPKVMPEVRRLEEETGLRVRYILSVGGGHHLFLPAWRDAFTEATVLVCPVRVPTTRSAKKLVDGPRVRAMDIDDPLPQFAGELEAVVFHGLYGVRDDRTPYEGGAEPGLFKMMKMMRNLDAPVDELWLHHVPTGTVIGGENLGWILSKQSIKAFPWMLRMMMKADSVYINDKARKVADATAVAACWRRILAWDAATRLGYHELPGEAFRGDGRAALTAAVQAVGQLPT